MLWVSDCEMITRGAIVLLHCNLPSIFVYQMQAIGCFSNIKFHCRFYIRYNIIPGMSFSIFNTLKAYNTTSNITVSRCGGFIFSSVTFLWIFSTIMEAEIYVSLKQRCLKGPLEGNVLWKCNKKNPFRWEFELTHFCKSSQVFWSVSGGLYST